MESPIWITGIGFVSSLGHNGTEVTQRLRSGESGIVPWRFSEERQVPVHLAGALSGFDTRSNRWSEWTWPEAFTVPQKLVRSLPPQGLYGYCALEQAFTDAGWSREYIAAPETGLFAGSVGSPQMAYHHLAQMHASPTWAAHPSAVISSIPGTLNFTLGAHFGVRGANVGFVSACAASAHAVGYAFDDLRRGRLDAAVVLGAEDFSPESLVPFAGMRALSGQKDPRRISPFDQERDGFVATGGAVALCLERASSAQERGARPYAELLGWGHSADGGTIANPDPSGGGLARAIRQALRETHLGVNDVGYINAHATGTVAGDRAELAAIRSVFHEQLDQLVVSGTKHLTGHGLSMSGAFEAALCALMIREGFIAGNHHLRTPDPAGDGIQLPRTSQDFAHRAVLSHSSGFGGSNVVLAMQPAAAHS